MRRIATLPIVLVGLGAVAMAATVTVVPDPPQAGSNVAITYDPAGGPLAGETTIYLHYGFNGWAPTVSPDPLMDTNGTINLTVPVPAQATEIKMAFHNGAVPQVWDNNAGLDWTFATTGGVPNAGVTVVPDPLEAGTNGTITYFPVDPSLDRSTGIYMHYGFNNWFPTISPDVLMTTNGNGGYFATVPMKSYAFEFDAAFRDGVPLDLLDIADFVRCLSGPGGGLAGTSGFETGCNVWDLDADALDIDLRDFALFQQQITFTHWDTNDGFDWRFAVTNGIPAVTVTPNPPVAGQPVTITYNPEDGPLNATTSAFLHWGINDFAAGIGPDLAMATNGAIFNSDSVWEVTIPEVPIRGCVLAFVFNDTGDPADPGTVWDNNNGNDWRFDTIGCKPAQSQADGLYVAKVEDPFEPSGDFDFLHVAVAGNLVNNGSAMVIFINVSDTTGQTELRANGAPGIPGNLEAASERNDVVSCSTVGMGTILPGEADYALYFNYAGTQGFFNEVQLRSTQLSTLACCGAGTLPVYASQVYVGWTKANDGNAIFEDDGGSGAGYAGGFNDTSTSGMPAATTTGLEVAIPAFNIGDNGLGRGGNFDIFVAIMPNDGGVQGQFNNQWLPPTSNGYCNPPEMFPLRADLSPVTSVLTLNQGALPVFSGTTEGVIDPAEYNGSADAVQVCPVADPVPDGTVTITPAAVQGQDVTVWYVSTNGPLFGASAITLNYGFDGSTTLPNTAAMTPTNGFTGSEWIATVTMPIDALQLDVNVSSNAVVDDNNGHDWHFEVSTATTGLPAVVIDPDPANAGQDVTVKYNPIGRPLEGASSVCIHYGFNGWNPTISPDPVMTATTGCKWAITIPVASFATGTNGLNMVFNDCGATWDNNDGNDWHFEVINTSGPPPWDVTDGNVDSNATLLATSTNGQRNLWAGLWNGFLYVATERADGPNNRDAFIFVAGNSNGLPMGQPWAKAGTVAAWDAYLAQEEGNGWVGWFDLGGGTNRSNVPQNTALPYLEGQFELAPELGAGLQKIWLAVGLWGTNNGDPMLPAFQVPEGNGDGNIDAAEYLEINLLDIQTSGL